MTSPSPRDLVRRAAEQHGDRLAVISGDERLTYRQLAERTAALAANLKRAGVGTGVRTGLMFANSVAYIVWYFGVLEAGGVVVPLSPSLAPAEAGDLLDTIGVRFLAAPEGASMPGAFGMLPVVEAAAEGGAMWRMARDYPALDTTPWTPDGFLLQHFSSGSTGRPKQMLKTEENIFHSYHQFCETHEFDANDVFLGVAPFYHVYGAAALLCAFYLGGVVSVLPRFLPAAVLSAARRDRPTVFLITPPMIETLGTCLLDNGDEKAFECLKLCTCSTAGLRKADRDRFVRRFGVPVRDRYGSTEAMGVAIDLGDDYVEGRFDRTYAGVEVAIFDHDGDPCPSRVHGHIGVRNAAASRCYVDDPENSARTFRNGYVFPGDQGYMDEQGRLFVVGRSDIINIGGYKVDQLEVERVIRESLPVKEVIVLAGERAGLPVVRAVVEADPARVTRAMVIEACRARLSSHKVPALVEIRERLERDANGKVLRASL